MAKKEDGEVDKKQDDRSALLTVSYKREFSVQLHNLLENPSAMIFSGYENIILDSDNVTFDLDRIGDNTSILVILEYFEYLCVADVAFSYIMPIMQSGFSMKEVFSMIKHHLRGKLIVTIDNWENINEMHMKYMGKVRY